VLVFWNGMVLMLDETLFHWLTQGTMSAPDRILVVLMGFLVVVNAVVAWISTTLNAIGAFSSQLKPTTVSFMVLCLLSLLFVGRLGMPGLALAAVMANGLCIAVPTYLQARNRLADITRPLSATSGGQP